MYVEAVDLYINMHFSYWLTYNITLVSDVQCNDLIFLNIVLYHYSKSIELPLKFLLNQGKTDNFYDVESSLAYLTLLFVVYGKV